MAKEWLRVPMHMQSRPYHFEEPQQAVQTILDARIHDSRTEVTVPPFR